MRIAMKGDTIVEIPIVVDMAVKSALWALTVEGPSFSTCFLKIKEKKRRIM